MYLKNSPSVRLLFLMPLLAAAFPLAGCSNEPKPTAVVQALQVGEAAASQPDAGTGAAAAEARILAPPYPRSRWRLTPPHELEKVVLWLSHILIRHDQVESSAVSLSFGDWTWPLPTAPRSREEAFALAEQLAARAQAAPEQFAALAREHSEDPVTRESGGSLGGVKAGQLVWMYDLLDAFAATEIGSVSRVVETPHGFHVFLRRAPPPPQVVSGSRIIIGHTGAGFLATLYPERPPPTRSRDEAMALATQIYEQARRNPNEFDSLVKRYSEHEDVIRRGDFGTWSNREPTPMPREIETLEGLKIGEVAAPIDSTFGIQVIRRTPNRKRTVFSVSAIQLRHQPGEPDTSPTSKAAILAKARSFATQIAADPSRFTALQAEHCCTSVFRIGEGRDPAPLVARLQGLRVGQVAQEPAEFGVHHLIPKLVARERFEVGSDAMFNLPAPNEVDFGYWLLDLDAATLQEGMRAVAEQAPSTLGLDVTTSEILQREHEHWADGVSDPDSQLKAFRALGDRVERLLGATDYERYRSLLNLQFQSVLIQRD
jgi:hypothetical protein